MFHSEQYCSCMGVCLWFVSSSQDLAAPLAISSQLQLVNSEVRRAPIYFKATRISVWHLYIYGTARKCRRKFLRAFRVESVPRRQTFHKFGNKLRITGLLIDKKQKHKPLVLTEGKQDDMGARLEHTARKSLERLAQETGVSKSSARTATQLLKLSLAAARPGKEDSFLQLVSTVCRRRWDLSAIGILFWWSVVSVARVHKYVPVAVKRRPRTSQRNWYVGFWDFIHRPGF
jgi:hypothetical protein